MLHIVPRPHKMLLLKYILGGMITEAIIAEINEAKFFAVISDEVASKEQISLVLRYIHKDEDFERKFCWLIHVKALKTSPYHPQTDGFVERFNKTLKEMSRKTAAEEGKDWDKLIHFLQRITSGIYWVLTIRTST